jgi:Glycosyl hydrolase family 76
MTRSIIAAAGWRLAWGAGRLAPGEGPAGRRAAWCGPEHPASEHPASEHAASAAATTLVRVRPPGTWRNCMTDPDYRTCAKAGVGALQRWYDPATGLWHGTGWWNSANALTAVVRYAKLTGDDSHASVIATTFTAAQRQHAGFANGFYDDNAWWALAWVAAFDVTRDSRYLAAARTIFTADTRA